MKAKCANCQKIYNIPDERLPQGGKVKFPCPSCKNPIELDLRSNGADQASSDPASYSSPAAEKGQATGDELKEQIFKSVKDLPPMPQVIHKARKVMASPNSSFKDLAIIFVTDQAIATRVLKLSNSAYYGLSKKVSSIQQASVILGHKTLAELITMVSTSTLLGNKLKGYGLEAGQLWEHSLAVAFGSRLIAQKKYPEFSDNAFAAGLIHDSGKLALDKYVFERHEIFEQFMANGEKTFLDAEKEILGFDHAEIASEVCRKWNVPEELATGIKYHHHPSQIPDNILANLLHAADGIAMMSGLGGGIDAVSYEIEEISVKFLGLNNKEISILMEKVVTSVQNTMQEFK